MTYWESITSGVRSGENRGSLQAIYDRLMCTSKEGAEAVKYLLEKAANAEVGIRYESFPNEWYAHGMWEVYPISEIYVPVQSLWEAALEKIPDDDSAAVTVNESKGSKQLICSTEEGTRALKTLFEADSGIPMGIIYRSALNKWELYVSG